MAKGKETELRWPVVRGKILGVKVFRGFGKLCDLAYISEGDVYDQQKNPRGTQRDLSPTHARQAYEYVKNNSFGFWPEVFLCIRKKDIMTYYPISSEMADIGFLEINVNEAKKSKGITISRIDGNHRLYYVAGLEPGFLKIEKTVSFCFCYDLTREEEIQLFKDINKNQMPMNTSHLDMIEVRLSSQQELKHRNPELYIANLLQHDLKSPFHGRIYEGGKKPTGFSIPLRAIKTGIEYMLSRSTQLPRLADAEAQYRVIKNYFNAVKLWQPKAWQKPKDYIVLRGVGFWAVCFIGAQVIDRVLLNGEFKTDHMLALLQSGKEWDWGNNGDFKGFSGRSGALEISSKVARKLYDENSLSTEQLFKKIMAE